jgi:hypothetical protein
MKETNPAAGLPSSGGENHGNLFSADVMSNCETVQIDSMAAAM